jgi:hypothetical protein
MDCSSKSAQAKSSQDPISKKILHRKGLVEWLKVQALNSSPSTGKKKKEKKKKERKEDADNLLNLPLLLT